MPRADTGRRARRPGRPRAGPAGRRWPGCRASSRSCSSGPMTSYGGATTAARSSMLDGSNRRARKGRISGMGPSGRRHGPTGTGRWHRTIRTAAARPSVSGHLTCRTPTTQLSHGARRPCSDHRRPNPVPESSCASLPDQATPSPSAVSMRADPCVRRSRPHSSPSPPWGCCPPRPPAADGLTVEAKALLDGHARVGSWMAIAVHMKNDGPAIDRRAADDRRRAGPDALRAGRGPADPARTRPSCSMPSRRPSGASSRSRSSTVSRPSRRPRSASPSTTARQLIVGVVAERPGDIVGGIDLLPNQNQIAPVIVPARPRGPARSASRPGAASTASSGRTSTRTGSRPASSTRCAAGSPAAAASSSSAARPVRTACPPSPTRSCRIGPTATVDVAGQLA